MAAEITSFEAWSATPGSNQPDDTDTASNLAENLRTIQAEVKEWLASAGTLDFTSSTDLSTVGSNYIAVSGTATVVTSFGILAAGIEKTLYFNAAHTLTHNATSLIIPTGANIVCAAGDVGKFVSLGSGNWRCTSYTRASGQQTAGNSTFADGSVSAPSIAFTSDTDTGFYSIGANSLGVTANGTKCATFSSTNVVFSYSGDVATFNASGGTIPTLATTTTSASTSVTTPKLTNTTSDVQIECATLQFKASDSKVQFGVSTSHTYQLTLGSMESVWGEVRGASGGDGSNSYVGFRPPDNPASLYNGDWVRIGKKTGADDQDGINLRAALNFLSVQSILWGTASFVINSDATAASATNLIAINADYSTTPDLVWRVTSAGTTFADGAYTDTGADYAEYFDYVGEKPEGGQTVALVGDAVKVAGDGDEVIGVISIKPAVVGDYQEGKEDRVIVGLVGKLKVRKGCPVDSRWRMMKEGDEFDLYLVR